MYLKCKRKFGNSLLFFNDNKSPFLLERDLGMGLKSEPTVISRGFFHQSKNEQLCFVTVVTFISLVLKYTKNQA